MQAFATNNGGSAPGTVLPPVTVGGRQVVPVDFERLEATVRFDVASRVAEVSARAELTLEAYEGLPAFDLRQTVATASFDGGALPPEALAPLDIGAGPGATVRAVDLSCLAGSRHQLEVRYALETPDAPGALPIGWEEGAVSWDLWMSDLEPGRYLEMWFPANLCHDRLSVELTVEVVGTSQPHILLANGPLDEKRPGSAWTVRYPATYTSLSHLLVLAPRDQAQVRTAVKDVCGRPALVTVATLPGAECEPADVVADTASWLNYFTSRYGARPHDDRFLAVMWGLRRGMEYDGATTASGPALEHEIFHTWFGRGVKPARPCDGWIDEAMASWATTSRRGLAGRFDDSELGLDEPPALLCPANPWSRYTPREAYSTGSRLLAGVAHLAGGAGRLRSALAGWYEANAGKSVTTEALARYLSDFCGRDLSPWWDRYVYGRDEHHERRSKRRFASRP
ncbi:MAG TPA: hypothetical protein VL984_12850 [Acidimicrobiales bacterium]|nr:hypothetical protein [Acidimicrobiales bacterium]